jgi:hypothetical protein
VYPRRPFQPQITPERARSVATFQAASRSLPVKGCRSRACRPCWPARYGHSRFSASVPASSAIVAYVWLHVVQAYPDYPGPVDEPVKPRGDRVRVHGPPVGVYAQPKCFMTASMPLCRWFCSALVSGAWSQYASTNAARTSWLVGPQLWKRVPSSTVALARSDTLER